MAAFALDEALGMRLDIEDRRALEEAAAEQKRGRPPEGASWAPEDAYDDAAEIAAMSGNGHRPGRAP